VTVAEESKLALFVFRRNFEKIPEQNRNEIAPMVVEEIVTWKRLIPDFMRSGEVSGIEVREWRKGGVLVELRGEFDQHTLKNLQETLCDVVALRRPTLVDLSEVTFLDVGATRELTIRSQLYAHHLTLGNPSWQARASVAACGFDN
jgi:anti-anti-sigma regulatory factor